MTDNDRNLGMELAMCLDSIYREESDWREAKADHTERMETLYNLRDKLKQEILTGQKRLPLEPPDNEKPLEIGGPSAADLDAAANDYPHRTDGETTISMGVRGDNGEMEYTPPVPLSDFKAAVDLIKGQITRGQ